VWPEDTFLGRLWFRSDPFGYEGVYKFSLGRPTGGSLSKDGLSTCRVLRKFRKEAFGGLIAKMVAFCSIQQEF
jgi:hypothetical protein